jgi:glycosyltransferase involved in cell wall biosynthesis
MASGLEGLGVRQPYLLSVGNAYPHKNLDGLLEAFALVRARRPEFSLVIAGYDDYFFRRLRREAASRGQDQGVVFVPSPADSVLSTLYGGARAFVAPAFIEGLVCRRSRR